MFTQNFDIATIGAGLRGFLSQKTALIEDGAATTPSARTTGSRTSENSPTCHGQALAAGFSDISLIECRRVVLALTSKKADGRFQGPRRPEVVAEHRTKLKSGRRLCSGDRPIQRKKSAAKQILGTIFVDAVDQFLGLCVGRPLGLIGAVPMQDRTFAIRGHAQSETGSGPDKIE
jgi:hypothetical protein